jgi:hypothetical protein
VLTRLASATPGVQEAYLSSVHSEGSNVTRRILHVVVEARRSRIVTRDLARGLRDAFTRDQRPEVRVHDPREPGLSLVRQHGIRLHPGVSSGVPWWILFLGG